jgi:hypothetical protein
MQEATSQIQSNRVRLRILEHSAVDHAASGQFEFALRSISGGADWAWFNHTGMFASPTFENLLATIGSRLMTLPPGPRSARRMGTRRRVLHVLTQAYKTGGHTRLAWRWMSLDRTSDHSVVLTNQYGIDVPQPLSDACDGRLTMLGSGSMTDQIRSLGRLMDHYDLVVLHIHPFDVVPVAACAGNPHRPRTLLVNHSDHVFWLGLSAADQLINLRPASELIAFDRRTYSRDRFARLAIPLDEPASDEPAGWDMRSSLGIPKQDPVVATIAEPYKYATTTGPSFMELVRELLVRVPEIHLVAVGPTGESPQWGGLPREFPTRVHLLGTRTDYRSVLIGSNVYLDSFPFSSITSMLEAALHGLPVITMSNESNGPLNFDDFGLDPRPVSSSEGWLERAELWCRDIALGKTVGSEMQESVRSVHGGTAWIDQLETLYSMPWGRADSPTRGGSTRLLPYDESIYQLHLSGGLTRDFGELLAIHGVVVSPMATVA